MCDGPDRHQLIIYYYIYIYDFRCISCVSFISIVWIKRIRSLGSGQEIRTAKTERQLIT